MGHKKSPPRPRTSIPNVPVLRCNEATGPVGPVGVKRGGGTSQPNGGGSLAAYVAGTSSTNWGIVRCHRWSPVFGGKVAKQTVEKWCSGGKKGLKYFTDFEQMNLEMEPWLKAVSQFYHLLIFPICNPWCWYIYLQNWVIFGANVGKYSIHGAYGFIYHTLW